MQFSWNIDGFRQNDSHDFLELIQLYKSNPIEKFQIFTFYQNYTLALRENSIFVVECFGGGGGLGIEYQMWGEKHHIHVMHNMSMIQVWAAMDISIT